MDAVGVQTLVDELRADHPVGERVVGGEDVGGGQRFVLRESPDVQFVDGEGAADLGGWLACMYFYWIWVVGGGGGLEKEDALFQGRVLRLRD